MDILVLPGDGIGPEITAATLHALEKLNRRHNLGLKLTHEKIGFAGLEAYGSTCTDAVLRRAEEAHGAILGPVSHADYPPRDKGGVNPSAAFRIGLQLYANLRPSYVRPQLPALAKAMDLLIVRENTEGFYADRNMFSGSGEFMPTPDVGLAVRKITRAGSDRIARAAFEQARARRRRVTIVHKSNVLKQTDGLFVECCREVARDYPDVETDALLVDAMASILVREPARFDVVVSTNMFGDILSNLAAELSGGLGLAESLNQGDKHAVAQASHGSAPDIAGQNRANPTALMLSAAMLLDWLGLRHSRGNLRDAAATWKAAVERCLADPARRTADLGGRLTTDAFAAAVADEIGARSPSP